MSGVVVGSRLDQLRALRRQIDVQIELEARQSARGLAAHGRVIEATAPVLPRQEPSPESLGPDDVVVPFTAVRPELVRDWAKAAGLTIPHHGPIPHKVVAAFMGAHR